VPGRVAGGLPRVQREPAAARDYYRTDGAMVITNSRFTAHARDYARRTGTVLWDRRRLADSIRRATQVAPRSTGT